MFYEKIKKITLVILYFYGVVGSAYGMRCVVRNLQPSILTRGNAVIAVQARSLGVKKNHVGRLETGLYNGKLPASTNLSHPNIWITRLPSQRQASYLPRELDHVESLFVKMSLEDRGKNNTDAQSLELKKHKNFTHTYFLEILTAAAIFGIGVEYYIAFELYDQLQQKEDLQRLLEALQGGYVNDHEEACVRCHSEIIEAFYKAITQNSRYAALANEAFADYMLRKKQIPSQALFSILLFYGPDPKILINALDAKNGAHVACLYQAIRYYQESFRLKETPHRVYLRASELVDALRKKTDTIESKELKNMADYFDFDIKLYRARHTIVPL